MAEAADGSLYVAQNGGVFGLGERTEEQAAPGIQRVANGEATYLVDGLDAPNDCCFGPDGRLYFTDPRGPASGDNQEPGRVFAMPPEGAPEMLAEGPRFTNGIAFGIDPSQLFVSETFAQRVLRYPVSDGRLGEPEEFCRLDAGFPDGMCFDQEGRLYVAATLSGQVQVFDPTGQLTERLACGDKSLPTNVCFGGPGLTTLYVTDARGERVLAFDSSTPGLPLYPFR
jgi:gluconolactonase